MLSASPSTRVPETYLQHATHLLPSQGPISVFVHHNTLHAFEELPFEQAVVAGGELFGCEPYLSESRFRREMATGRIGLEDLQAVLLADLGDSATQLIATFGTRYALRLAMLQFPLRTAPEAELQWLIAETKAHSRFREEVEPARREQLIAATRTWVLRGLHSHSHDYDSAVKNLVQELIDERSSRRNVDSWTEAEWEAFTLRFLWRTCQLGIQQAQRGGQRPADSPWTTRFIRHRDLLLTHCGRDSDRLVDEILIRFTAAFLDQGFADWELPERDVGFFRAFAQLYRCSACPIPPWLRGLSGEMKQVLSDNLTPQQSIAHSLQQFSVPDQEQDDFILHCLLALRGWAGLIWQMESNAPWTPRPAPAGTLEGFLAVRLILERYALASLARQEWGKLTQSPLAHISQLRHRSERVATTTSPGSLEQQAFTIFQLAQVRGWLPQELVNLAPVQWKQLLSEVQSFSSIERRRVFHLAYERKYRNAALDAIVNHRSHRTPKPTHTPAYQIVTCIDDREESFRRHLEECDPECQTYGAAGFFAVAMYYQGAAEAHYRPLCPIVITPQHYVREEPVFSATDVNETRSQRRKWVGQMTHAVHSRSRTLMGGMVTGLLGSLATFPLVARILAPRLTAQLRSNFGNLVRPPATELHIERVADKPGREFDELGYSIPEMAGIVTRLLQDIGLVQDFAPIVLFTGHGSSSLNNPHESAYNCGACSGGRGGPNARSFALMANDPRVRHLVAQNGINIPESVRFVGAYHNTCNDHVEYFDLDQLPRTHRPLFRRVEASVHQARARNAQERSRRFESAPLDMSPAQALEHVEERAEDLSQARPEYNHATNAMCFVGRREWSRGLFLDRRAFLASYDPSIDDEQVSILSRVLAAAIPVCAGISLEYLFSTIDNEGYGCGSKLPHNIAALAGVMTGAASDIRPGLSAQMVEIHEPMRILFVIETTPEKFLRIMQGQPIIDRLVRQAWVQIATLDAQQNRVHVFADGRFVEYQPETDGLSVAPTSLDWYGGLRDHVGFASIVATKIDNSRSSPSRPSIPIRSGVPS